MGPGVPPEWGCPEQGHSPQEGAGVSSQALFSLDWRCRDCCPGDCCHPLLLCVSSPLTTEEVVDDGVGSAVGIHQPVGESEAGIDSFPVVGLAEHSTHPRTRGAGHSETGRVCVCVLSGRSHHPHLAYRKTKTQKRKVISVRTQVRR